MSSSSSSSSYTIVSGGSKGESQEQLLLLERLDADVEGKLVERREKLKGLIVTDKLVFAQVKGNFLIVRRKHVAEAEKQNVVEFVEKTLVLNLDGCMVQRNEKEIQVLYLAKRNKSKKVRLVMNSEQEGDKWLQTLEKKIRQSLEQRTNNAKIKLDDFEPLWILGKGHFGRVTLAKHRGTEKLVALKEMREETPKTNNRRKPGSVGKRVPKKTLQELKLEKQVSERILLAKVASFQNPYLAKLAFAFRENGKLYFAQEFAPRGDLWSMLRNKKRISIDSTRQIVAQVINGVEALHHHGIVHRDIKLENIMLDVHGNVKIIDLGLAKQLSRRSKGKTKFGYTFSFVGTKYYMPPEILSNVGHTLSADWWQVGCLIFELIAGRPAFFHKVAAKVEEKILSINGPDMDLIRKHVGQVADLEDIVESLLVHDNMQRLGAKGSEEIRDHAFFANHIDWQEVEDCQLEVTQEISEYVSCDGFSVNESTISSYFRDSKTLEGKPLNGILSSKQSSHVESRKKVCNGGSNTFESEKTFFPTAVVGKTLSSASSSSSSSSSSSGSRTSASSGTSESSHSTLSSRATESKPIQGEKLVTGLVPILRQDSFGPMTGFEFRVDKRVLDEFEF